MSEKIIKIWFPLRFFFCYLLSGEFDELFKKWHSFIKISRRYDLRHDPILNLIKASNEHIQIARVLMIMKKRKSMCVWVNEGDNKLILISILEGVWNFFNYIKFFMPSCRRFFLSTRAHHWAICYASSLVKNVYQLTFPHWLSLFFFFNYPHFLIILSDINAQRKCPREHHCDMMR